MELKRNRKNVAGRVNNQRHPSKSLKEMRLLCRYQLSKKKSKKKMLMWKYSIVRRRFDLPSKKQKNVVDLHLIYARKTSKSPIKRRSQISVLAKIFKVCSNLHIYKEYQSSHKHYCQLLRGTKFLRHQNNN